MICSVPPDICYLMKDKSGLTGLHYITIPCKPHNLQGISFLNSQPGTKNQEPGTKIKEPRSKNTEPINQEP